MTDQERAALAAAVAYVEHRLARPQRSASAAAWLAWARDIRPRWLALKNAIENLHAAGQGGQRP